MASKAQASRKAKMARHKKNKGFVTNSPLSMPKEQYLEMLEGLKAQGIDHKEAVLTLKIGLREANGIPVPLDLLAQCTPDPVNSASAS